MDTRPRMYLAELFGTFLMVLIGAGTICAAICRQPTRAITPSAA